MSEKTYDVSEPELGNDLLAALRRPKNETVLYAAAYDAAVKIEEQAAEIERLKADLANVDAVLYYYIAKNWPSYTEREREGKTWKPEMMEHQSAAMARHSERFKRTHEQRSGTMEG